MSTVLRVVLVWAALVLCVARARAWSVVNGTDATAVTPVYSFNFTGDSGTPPFTATLKQTLTVSVAVTPDATNGWKLTWAASAVWNRTSTLDTQHQIAGSGVYVGKKWGEYSPAWEVYPEDSTKTTETQTGSGVFYAAASATEVRMALNPRSGATDADDVTVQLVIPLDGVKKMVHFRIVNEDSREWTYRFAPSGAMTGSGGTVGAKQTSNVFFDEAQWLSLGQGANVYCRLSAWFTYQELFNPGPDVPFWTTSTGVLVPVTDPNREALCMRQKSWAAGPYDPGSPDNPERLYEILIGSNKPNGDPNFKADIKTPAGTGGSGGSSPPPPTPTPSAGAGNSTGANNNRLVGNQTNNVNPDGSLKGPIILPGAGGTPSGISDGDKAIVDKLRENQTRNEVLWQNDQENADARNAELVAAVKAGSGGGGLNGRGSGSLGDGTDQQDWKDGVTSSVNGSKGAMESAINSAMNSRGGTELVISPSGSTSLPVMIRGEQFDVNPLQDSHVPSYMKTMVSWVRALIGWSLVSALIVWAYGAITESVTAVFLTQKQAPFAAELAMYSNGVTAAGGVGVRLVLLAILGALLIAVPSLTIQLFSTDWHVLWLSLAESHNTKAAAVGAPVAIADEWIPVATAVSVASTYFLLQTGILKIQFVWMWVARMFAA